MFLDGADIYSDTTAEQVLLTTAECGTVLAYNGRQDGEWFHVTLGDINGWVNGYRVSFERSEDFCQKNFPAESNSSA